VRCNRAMCSPSVVAGSTSTCSSSCRDEPRSRGRVKAGRFREDPLLSAQRGPIRVPPVRERVGGHRATRSRAPCARTPSAKTAWTSRSRSSKRSSTRSISIALPRQCRRNRKTGLSFFSRVDRGRIVKKRSVSGARSPNKREPVIPWSPSVARSSPAEYRGPSHSLRLRVESTIARNPAAPNSESANRIKARRTPFGHLAPRPSRSFTVQLSRRRKPSAPDCACWWCARRRAGA